MLRLTIAGQKQLLPVRVFRSKILHRKIASTGGENLGHRAGSDTTEILQGFILNPVARRIRWPVIFHLKQRQRLLYDKTPTAVFDQEDVGGDSSAEGSEPDVTPGHEPITAQNIK